MGIVYSLAKPQILPNSSTNRVTGPSPYKIAKLSHRDAAKPIKIRITMQNCRTLEI